MKAAGLFNTILAFVLLFTTVSASWRWLLFERHAALDRRQNNNQNDNESSTSSTPTRTTNSRSATSSDEESASSTTNSDSSETTSGTNTRSGTATRSGSGSRNTTSAKSTLVDPRLPAGGVALVTPAATAGSQYYKVGDFVTFEWNYTSLSNTPSYIDVFATCNLNSATYTIASNMTVEETGRVIWDTGDQEEITAAFPVATYTLFIHDAGRDPTQVASAGDLAAYNQFRFGMYTGQPYTPLNEFKCSTCSNAALSLHERQALGVLGVTVAVTVLSATWFASGAGLFA